MFNHSLSKLDESKRARWLNLIAGLKAAPGTYVGKATYARIRSYLEGFDYGIETGVLQEFGKWLVDKNPAVGSESSAWWACVLEEALPGSNEESLTYPAQDSLVIEHLLTQLQEFLVSKQLT